MKQGLSELIFILDRSGSMSNLTKDTIGGFNGLIQKQREAEGTAYVTTVLFDNEYKILHDHVLLSDVKDLTDKEYFPRGTTALLDAVGMTINRVGERLSNTPEEERPEDVIVVIVTDGYENASHEFTKAQVKSMIEHQQSKYSWTFMFLGANMDAVSEGDSLGISKAFSKTYTQSSAGLGSAYTAMAMSMSSIRNYSSVSLDSLDMSDMDDMAPDEIIAKKKQKAREAASSALDNIV